MRDLNRQQALDRPPQIPDSISVVGVGGIGTWVSIIGAMAGVRDFRIFDSDVMDRSNLNRLPFRPQDVGKPKVEVVGQFLKGLDPDIEVAMFPNLTPETEEYLNGGVVFICTDDGPSRNFAMNLCKKKNVHYVNGAYDGHSVTITPYPLFDFRVRTGYEVDPSWAAPTVIIAGLMWYAAGYAIDDLRLTLNILEELNGRAKNRRAK